MDSQSSTKSGGFAPAEPHPSLPGKEAEPVTYGTAWKKERTAELVYQAIKAGYRDIDTAAMEKHYREDLVGQGIRRAVVEEIVSRGQLWVSSIAL
jgi:diketogulonate reductase-like aldo/keto reductase